MKIVLSLINSDLQITRVTNVSKSLFYLISLCPWLPLITLSFPSLTVEAALHLPACLPLWPYILSVSCWFAFPWLCLEGDVLEDSIPGHLFTVNLFLQQSNKFLLFKIPLYMSLTPKSTDKGYSSLLISRSVWETFSLSSRLFTFISHAKIDLITFPNFRDLLCFPALPDLCHF